MCTSKYAQGSFQYLMSLLLRILKQNINPRLHIPKS